MPSSGSLGSAWLLFVGASLLDTVVVPVGGVRSACFFPGMISDGNNCRSYYNCVQGVRVRGSCKANQIFIPKISKCVRIPQRLCVPREDSPDMRGKRCETQNAKRPFFIDCDRYLVCKNHTYEEVMCPRNRVYNQVLGACVFEDDVCKTTEPNEQLSFMYETDTSSPYLIECETQSHKTFAEKNMDPYDCRLYFKCGIHEPDEDDLVFEDLGIINTMRCPNRTLFSSVTNQCEDASKVVCGDRFRDEVLFGPDPKVGMGRMALGRGGPPPTKPWYALEPGRYAMKFTKLTESTSEEEYEIAKRKLKRRNKKPQRTRQNKSGRRKNRRRDMPETETDGESNSDALAGLFGGGGGSNRALLSDDDSSFPQDGKSVGTLSTAREEQSDLDAPATEALSPKEPEQEVRAWDYVPRNGETNSTTELPIVEYGNDEDEEPQSINKAVEPTTVKNASAAPSPEPDSTAKRPKRKSIKTLNGTNARSTRDYKYNSTGMKYSSGRSRSMQQEPNPQDMGSDRLFSEPVLVEQYDDSRETAVIPVDPHIELDPPNQTTTGVTTLTEKPHPSNTSSPKGVTGAVLDSNGALVTDKGRTRNQEVGPDGANQDVASTMTSADATESSIVAPQAHAALRMRKGYPIESESEVGANREPHLNDMSEAAEKKIMSTADSPGEGRNLAASDTDTYTTAPDDQEVDTSDGDRDKIKHPHYYTTDTDYEGHNAEHSDGYAPNHDDNISDYPQRPDGRDDHSKKTVVNSHHHANTDDYHHPKDHSPEQEDDYYRHETTKVIKNNKRRQHKSRGKQRKSQETHYYTSDTDFDAGTEGNDPDVNDTEEHDDFYHSVPQQQAQKSNKIHREWQSSSVRRTKERKSKKTTVSGKGREGLRQRQKSSITVSENEMESKMSDLMRRLHKAEDDLATMEKMHQELHKAETTLEKLRKVEPAVEKLVDAVGRIVEAEQKLGEAGGFQSHPDELSTISENRAKLAQATYKSSDEALEGRTSDSFGPSSIAQQERRLRHLERQMENLSKSVHELMVTQNRGTSHGNRSKPKKSQVKVSGGRSAVASGEDFLVSEEKPPMPEHRRGKGGKAAEEGGNQENADDYYVHS